MIYGLLRFARNDEILFLMFGAVFFAMLQIKTSALLIKPAA
jgi:hypothetical protein